MHSSFVRKNVGPFVCVKLISFWWLTHTIKWSSELQQLFDLHSNQFDSSMAMTMVTDCSESCTWFIANSTTRHWYDISININIIIIIIMVTPILSIGKIVFCFYLYTSSTSIFLVLSIVWVTYTTPWNWIDIIQSSCNLITSSKKMYKRFNLFFIWWLIQWDNNLE